MAGIAKLPPRPVGPKPKAPTEAELRARTLQQENLGGVCQQLVQADLHRPFTNVADAVQRLLPFHVSRRNRPESVQHRHVTSRHMAGSGILRRGGS